MYQPGYSVIHGINAAVKLVCLILLLAAVVATDSVPGYVVSILTTAAIVYLAQISIPDALSPPCGGCCGFFVLILFDEHLLLWAGRPVGALVDILPVHAGARAGANVVLQSVVLILILSNVLTTTTAPTQADGRDGAPAFSPARHKGANGQVAMIISVAIQFIPHHI